MLGIYGNLMTRGNVLEITARREGRRLEGDRSAARSRPTMPRSIWKRAPTSWWKAKPR